METGSSSRPDTRVPRNSKLSAYYTRAKAQNGSTASSTPSPRYPPPSPTATSDLPTTGGRQAAIEYSNALAQSLSLTQLMTRSSELRAQAQSLSSSLHVSSRQYYTHLASSNDAAQTSVKLAERLVGDSEPAGPIDPLLNGVSSTSLAVMNGDIDHKPPSDNETVSAAISSYTQRCSQIAARLQPMRERIDALEGVQHIALLLQASTSLANTLKSLYEDATDLCTDETAVRARLFTAARRYAAIMPAMAQLAKKSPDFKTVYTDLLHTGNVVRTSLKTLFFPIDDDVSAGEGSLSLEEEAQVLSLHDASRLRVLLGHRPSDFREGFFRAAMRYAVSLRPSRASINAAGKNIGVAKLHVAFAEIEVLPRLFEIGEWYTDVFSGADQTEEDNVEVWQQFVIWMNDVADEAIAMRVRRELQGDFLHHCDATSMTAFTKAVHRLREVAKDRVRDGGCGPVADVVIAISEEMEANFIELGRSDARMVLTKNVARVLNGDFKSDFDGGVRAARVLYAVVEDVCKGGDLFEGDAWWEVHTLAVEAGRIATADSIKGGFVEVGRAAMLCKQLAVAVIGDRDSTERLKAMADRLTERAKLVVCERVELFMRERLRILCGSSVEASGNSPELYDILQLLTRADEVGTECNIPSMRRGSESGSSGIGEESFFLEEGWVGRTVLRGWIEMIRHSCVQWEQGVHAMQLDAKEIGRCVRYDVGKEIALAAIERCADGQAVALSNDEVNVLLSQRVTNK